MITGMMDFIVSVDVEVKDEEELNKLTEETKRKLEEAFPKFNVEYGDQDVEALDDEDETE